MAMALMPTVSYAQARADKQADLSYTTALADLRRQQLAEKQAAQQKMSNQFAALKSLGIEAPDQSRVNMLVDDMRKSISDKILEKYDGDVRKYMMYEGENDLQEYTSGVLNSPVLQQALKNKYAFGVYAMDVKDGKDYQRRVSYTLNDGTKKEGVPFSEAMADYYAFKTAELPYNGSFEIPKGAMEFFTKTHKPGFEYGTYNEKTRGYDPVQVDAQDYFEYLTNNADNPMSAQDAAALVQDVYPMLNMQWATKDPLEIKKFELDVWSKKDASARGWAQVENQKMANYLKAKGLQGAQMSVVQGYLDPTVSAKPVNIGGLSVGATKIGPNDREKMLNLLGVAFTKKEFQDGKEVTMPKNIGAGTVLAGSDPTQAINFANNKDKNGNNLPLPKIKKVYDDQIYFIPDNNGVVRPYYKAVMTSDEGTLQKTMVNGKPIVAGRMLGADELGGPFNVKYTDKAGWGDVGGFLKNRKAEFEGFLPIPYDANIIGSVDRDLKQFNKQNIGGFGEMQMITPDDIPFSIDEE